MASFEIADCLTKLQLAEQDKAGKKTQTGTLTLTVRNTTDRQRTGRVKVEPDQGAKPEWFALQGAAATNPREFEQDFAARGTQTVRVTVTVPGGEAAKSCLFRLVVTDETDPDNDFAKGPNVAFEIKTPPPPAPPPHLPWWIFVAAGVVVLLVVGGIVAYLLIPSGPQQVEVAGLTADAAKKKLVDAGFAEANIATANDSQTSGHQSGTVTHADYPDKTHVNLFLDPGGPHQVDVVGLTAAAAKKNLVDAGFPEANIQVLTDRQTSGRDRGTVVRADYPDAMHVNITIDPGVPVAQEVMLVNVKTGKCLTIAGGTLPDNNIPAVQFDCDGDPSRRWRLNETSRDIYQIRNVKTGKCLTIAGGVSRENNVTALQFDCDSHPSRTWRLDNVRGASYQIRNVQTDKCLTIAGGTRSDNNIEALQFNCDDDTSRRWTIN